MFGILGLGFFFLRLQNSRTKKCCKRKPKEKMLWFIFLKASVELGRQNTEVLELILRKSSPAQKTTPNQEWLLLLILIINIYIISGYLHAKCFPASAYLNCESIATRREFTHLLKNRKSLFIYEQCLLPKSYKRPIRPPSSSTRD